LEVRINGIFDVIEKGFEAGISVSFGGLFGSVSELGQKRKNLVWDEYTYLYFDEEGRFKVEVWEEARNPQNKEPIKRE
jgi:hypothetical protein